MKSMKSLMRHKAGFLLSLISVIGSNADQQINIVNDTASSLNVNLSVPAKTEAIIQMKKLHNQQPQEMLLKAILNNSAAEVRIAVRAGANINDFKDGKSPLLCALLLKHHNALEILLQLGAKPDDVCKQQAIKMYDVQSVLMLVRHGCQINFDKMDIYYTIICSHKNPNESYDLIKELVNRGYNINELWFTVIAFASANQSIGVEVIRFLLFRGANPNYIIEERDCYGSQGNLYTPLSLASANFPSMEIVKTLIHAGADINQKVKLYRKNFITTLSLAIELENGNSNRERKEIIDFLIEQGASL